MKKISVLFFACICILSCSENGIFLDGDEDIRTELDIIKIIETSYAHGDITNYKVSILENRSLKIDSFYNKNRELTSYMKWNYDRDTLLISVEKFDSLHVLVPEKSKYITFGNQKRITNITTTNNVSNYNYDETNFILISHSITSQKDSVFINSDQKIYKKTNSVEKTELEYTNNRISKLTNTNGNSIKLTTYFYNTVTEPKGFLWNDVITNTFKNSNNAVLFYSLKEAAKIYSNYYISRIARSNGEQDVITYVLDSNGYLEKCNSSVNGDFRLETTFFFE